MNLPRVISCSYYFFIACCMWKVYFIMSYIASFVFISVECFSVFVHSSVIYIIIATNILLAVDCVEGFRTTIITMYMFLRLQGMLYY